MNPEWHVCSGFFVIFTQRITMKKHLGIFLILGFIIISCNQNAIKKEFADKEKYMHLGDSITRLTFDTLSRTLKSQILAAGPEGALLFCNHEALKLTGLYETEFNATVKRTSHKLRNPKNAPDSREQALLKWFEDNPGAAPFAELHPQGEIRYFKPIVVMENCMLCHGNQDTFSED